MKISESDVLMTHSIAKLLGVELEPWQEFMLKHMLAGYRQRFEAPPADQIEYGPPWCGSGHPSGDNIFCSLRSGHGGDHRSAVGTVWKPDQVLAPNGPCRAVHPSSAGAVPIRCVRPRGHLGNSHQDSDGLRWPVSD